MNELKKHLKAAEEKTESLTEVIETASLQFSNCPECICESKCPVCPVCADPMKATSIRSMLWQTLGEWQKNVTEQEEAEEEEALFQIEEEEEEESGNLC